MTCYSELPTCRQIATNSGNNAYRDIGLVDPALATSAAPSYFPPYEVNGLGYFTDGGVFANNPSVAAIAEALASGCAGNLDNVRLLSLGTGISPQGIPPDAVGNPLNWGVTTWLWPTERGNVPTAALLGLTLDTTATIAAHQAEQILKSAYQHGNFVLAQPVGLDDWQKVSELENETQAYMRSAAWQRVCDWWRRTGTDRASAACRQACRLNMPARTEIHAQPSR